MANIVTPNDKVRHLSYDEQNHYRVLAKEFNITLKPVVSSHCGSWTGELEARNKFLEAYPELTNEALPLPAVEPEKKVEVNPPPAPVPVSFQDLQKKWEKNLRAARKDLESLGENGPGSATAIRVHYMEQIVADLGKLMRRTDDFSLESVSEFIYQEHDDGREIHSEVLKTNIEEVQQGKASCIDNGQASVIRTIDGQIVVCPGSFYIL